MLSFNIVKDKEKMKNYYRTNDMINLLEFFPEVSPIADLTIIENEEDYKKNQNIIENLNNSRIDNLKGRSVNLGVESSGRKEDFLPMLKKIKEIDENAVLVLFNVMTDKTERYERYAGISVRVDVGECVYIDAVGKGFDGREVSKSICAHERYLIPWYDLRRCCIENFKTYQTYQINKEDYKKTRLERIEFLKSIGLNEEVFKNYIPEEYKPIPDFVWLSVIRGILKNLEEKEEVLLSRGFRNFAISGHTEGRNFMPWQLFDKSRYDV